MNKEHTHKIPPSALVEVLRDWTWQGLSIPSHMHDGLLRYLVGGIPPGLFLRSLLQGDLFAAYRYADRDNAKAFGTYCAFLYEYANPLCFGSEEKVIKWLDDNW